MKILAFEFSSSQRSVAVVCPEAEAWRSLSEVVETGTQATKAVGMIEEALKQAQVEREQIDCVAVGLGPGSYTGIRAAIAVAQGWQLARPVKLIGISSVDCLAAQVQADGFRGRAAAVIDAQRRELYFSVYDVGEQGWREVEPLRLIPVADAQETVRSGLIAIGPEAKKWFPEGRLVFPRAATAGQLAAERPQGVMGEKLEPIYLRQTQFIKAPPPRW